MKKTITLIGICMLILVSGCNIYNELYVQPSPPKPILDNDVFYQQSKILDGFETECIEERIVYEFNCEFSYETCNAIIKVKDYYKWSEQEKLKYMVSRLLTLGLAVSEPLTAVKYCEKNKDLTFDEEGNIIIDFDSPFCKITNKTICIKERLVRNLE